MTSVIVCIICTFCEIYINIIILNILYKTTRKNNQPFFLKDATSSILWSLTKQCFARIIFCHRKNCKNKLIKLRDWFTQK